MDVLSSLTAGVRAVFYVRGTDAATQAADQFVVPRRDRIVSFDGRAASFSTPGRAAVDQKITAIYNATGSTVLVAVQRVRVDLLTTAAKAPTVIPPMIRLVRFTAAPTGGNALVKAPLDSAGASNASVSVLGDSSGDGTSGAGVSSATTLTLTAGATITQHWAPRMITAAGVEFFDSIGMLAGEPEGILRANEGLAVFLTGATVTTGNPASDKWLSTIDFQEFTRP